MSKLIFDIFLNKCEFSTFKTLNKYLTDVLKPRDYAKTFFHRSPLHISYPKANTGHLVDPQGPLGRMFRKLRIQGRMQIFEKMSQKALNRVLTLPDYSILPELLISSGIIDLQNNRVCKQFKH